MTLKDRVLEYLLNYIYLLWDGLGFFGFDDNKLARLKGKPARWYDRFVNKRWMIFNLSFLIFVLVILSKELKTLGNVKS